MSASEAQIKLMNDLKLDFDDGITKEDASKLIESKLGKSKKSGFSKTKTNNPRVEIDITNINFEGKDELYKSSLERCREDLVRLKAIHNVLEDLGLPTYPAFVGMLFNSQVHQ